ncbi:uncharacterized protein RHIMIDRAFT_263742 [Rhizopus microsporus ATCC 52813]|uniref:Uncharacterized protein n=1 Tax=Rhizopus microsporus ATCC 52813 TaxID=1340429 RepID=A0A2G4SKR7_RHIZD|nr:uncharacterized protein RHIMIDRAFT_263742 [Rhizopus microsporus ATCC 52813]PHZ09377.1 hypothetical protein RHIMIDRAFT_263742 [Rhizopus microsporus ATCC 52813]
MSIIILLGALMISLFLPLSDTTKEAILQKLRAGYGGRDIRAAIQRHFNERIKDFFPEAANSSLSSVYVVHRLLYKKHNEQKESNKLWLKNLQQQRGYFTYIAQDFEQSYTFNFVSPW